MFGSLTFGSIVRYVSLPQIMPRLQHLLMGGLGYIPFCIALVYQIVGLLPKNHPFTLAQNMSRFGVRDVVTEAGRNVQWNLKHIDQIILFFAVLMGLVLFSLQILMLFVAVFMGSAMASMPSSWIGFFQVSDPNHDLAYMMLDLVFGVPHPSPTADMKSFFESCVGSSVTCQNYTYETSVSAFQTIPNMSVTVVDAATTNQQFSPLTQQAYLQFPFPVHLGLHELFRVYTSGLLLIAVMVTSYFVAVVLAETAQTGTPFGRRFNKTWAPLRIVMAFGLLMPMASGLNTSQYLVLYAAKYGSAFASNGWKFYNDTLSAAYLDNGQSMIAEPSTPDFNDLNRYLTIAHACGKMYNHYLVDVHNTENNDNKTEVADLPDATQAKGVRLYVIGRKGDAVTAKESTVTTAHLSPEDAFDAYNDDVRSYYSEAVDAITLVYGYRDPEAFKEHPGGVKPVCGEVQIPLHDLRESPTTDGSAPSAGSYPIDESKADYGAMLMQMYYYWYVAANLLDTGYFKTSLGLGSPPQIGGSALRWISILPMELQAYYKSAAGGGFDVAEIDASFVTEANAHARDYISWNLLGPMKTHYVNMLVNSVSYIDQGWGAAGIWYNRIAEMHSVMTASVMQAPKVAKYPMAMEAMAELNLENNRETEFDKRFKPELANIGDPGGLLAEENAQVMVQHLWKAYDTWTKFSGSGGDTGEENNPITAMISKILGVDGLYRLKNNQNTHPLAMVAGLGRSLVESSINAIGVTLLSSLAGALNIAKAAAKMVGSLFVTIAMLGLTVGVILFYVIPFLPFIYFYFAVGGWVKGIFEALVGAPLWALAHIRIDGDGLPGKAGMVGYYLIFEVFLRPILILFGLIASISVFSALVQGMNNVFDAVLDNVGGMDVEGRLEDGLSLANMRSRVDEFFYTIMYAVLVYLMGMSSFKMIDMIPNNILRWMGQNVSTFNDQQENPAEGMVGKMQMGSQQVVGKMGGGLAKVVGATTS